MLDLSFLDGRIVYHGSTVEIKDIDLQKARVNCDFGAAFYLTTSENQAIAWARKQKKRQKAESAVLNTYRISTFAGLELNSRIFEVADEGWFSFIVNNRKGKWENRSHNFHVVVGSVADDNVFSVLAAYEAGIFDFDGGHKVIIERLKVKDLEDQIALCTECAVKRVKFLRSLIVC